MADATDAYAEHVARKRATVTPNIEVTPSFTEREAKLLIELVDLTAKQIGTPEQVAIMTGAARKIELALRRALNSN